VDARRKDNKVQHFPNTASHASASSETPALCIKHSVTADMDDGQPLPPFIEDGCAWHLVRRADSRTLWRRIFLSFSVSPVIDWRTAPGDQAEAP
jgi:hypothetical protein